MSKRGDAYQEAVAEVARGLEPNACVDVGEWVEGPDGRRDLDVAVRRSSYDAAPLVLIECKDWGRPLGIGAIDALDSKRRDLGVSIAMICSNSGFSADAVRKAARVGIPVLSALIEGDSRIRVEVEDEILTKRINIELNSTWHFLVPNAKQLLDADTTVRDLVVDGRLAGAWIRDKAIAFAMTSVASRQLVVKYTFKEPVPLHIREIVLLANGVDLTMNLTIQWCSQVVHIGASSGMYDYLRKRVVFGPGASQYLLKNVDYERWLPIDNVPPELLTPPTPRDREMVVSLSLVTGMDLCDDAPAPALDSLVDKREIIETKADGAAASSRNRRSLDLNVASVTESSPPLNSSVLPGHLERDGPVDDRRVRVLASSGLAVGAVFGMAGTFAPSPSLRGVAWGIDGVALVMAGALLTIWFFRKGQDLVASGFLVFVVGQGIILSSAAMDLAASAPSFGAGASLWALALVLISAPSVFPSVVRALGFVASGLFAATALQIFAGAQVTPTTSPLPFHAYPVLVATLGGWVWTLLMVGRVAPPTHESPP